MSTATAPALKKSGESARSTDLSKYPIVYAYGDSGEDREMMALADKKYYRWKEIAGWDEVRSYGHPDVGRVDDTSDAL